MHESMYIGMFGCWLVCCICHLSTWYVAFVDLVSYILTTRIHDRFFSLHLQVTTGRQTHEKLSLTAMRLLGGLSIFRRKIGVGERENEEAGGEGDGVRGEGGRIRNVATQ